LEANENFLNRIKKDGSGRERIASANIISMRSVSPDGEWVAAGASFPGGIRGTAAIPVRGGEPRNICNYNCPSWWSPDGKILYVTTETANSTDGRTLVIPLAPGKALPALPESGITSRADRLDIPGIRTLRHGTMSAGNDPSTYVYAKQYFQGNLFRVPLH
jgi:hypothetical protein